MAVTASYLTEIVAQAHTPQMVRPAEAPRKPGFFSRFLRALEESRQRQVEAELARHGWVNDLLLTDAADRKISDSMFGAGRPLI
jgi:hypothetical protein